MPAPRFCLAISPDASGARPRWQRLAWLLLLLAWLAACTSAPVRNPMAEWRGSPNHDTRRAQLVVLHQTEMDSAEAALLTLRTRNAAGRVSAHYLVGADGRLYQRVDESARAWHAGAARWAGIADINSAAIGIELDNDGQSPFTDVQIDTLLRLLGDVTTRLAIPRHLVVGHADVAPTRKRDPGVLFPWKRLAEAGFGLWPREVLAVPPPGFDPWAALRLIGYDLRDPAAARRAYHRHFRATEGDAWLPGDAEILFDLQRQLVDPVAAPAPIIPESVPQQPSHHDAAMQHVVAFCAAHFTGERGRSLKAHLASMKGPLARIVVTANTVLAVESTEAVISRMPLPPRRFRQ